MDSFACGLCLGPLVSPVTLACSGGHSFCQSCLSPLLAHEGAPHCPLDGCPVPRQLPAVSPALAQALAAAEASRGGRADLPTIPSSDLILGEELGRGAYGQVHSAAWLGRAVAVKSLQASNEAVGEAAVRSFEREIRALGALHHPHIVRVHGIAVLAGGRVGLVEELAVGGTLSDLLRPGAARLPPELLVSTALGIARALAYAHARGVTHCDLKSGNVVLAEGGVPKLCDFGQASRVRALPGAAILTSTAGDGGMLGTPAWMAPENFEPGVGYGQPPGDVYSLGCVLYEMASGVQPWEGHGWMEIGRAVDRGERPDRPEGVEGRVWALIERCWAGEARQRPSAAEVVGVLVGWQREAAALVEPVATQAAARQPVEVGGGRLTVGTLVKATAAADESDILGRAGSGLRGRVVKDDLSEKPYKVQLVDGSDFDCEWGGGGEVARAATLQSLSRHYTPHCPLDMGNRVQGRGH